MSVILIQSDQLSKSTALLQGRRPSDTIVIFVESIPELTLVPFHKQRLTFILSAMRHFAEALRKAGFTVSYYRLCKDPDSAIRSAVEEHAADEIAIMQSASSGVDDAWAERIRNAGATPKVLANDMFVSERIQESVSFPPKKAVRMESFYRKMRRATGILMHGAEPLGGQWNYDKENRRPAASELVFPKVPAFPPDEITREAMGDVETHFPSHMGHAKPFRWPVTHRQAERFLEDFLDYRLASFGPYQDAMVDGEDTLFHALISVCLNIGLLDPEDVCRKAEVRLEHGDVPLNSVEGFIRQILGWREFVYQLYQANMPGYDRLNQLEAALPLPAFYWSGDTRMRCLAESIRPVLERGLSHHIQRLMITGNFALLAGVSPQELNSWYWAGFVDAWHWVVTPNVIGMATFADGGLMASKPYAASANYIQRMSDYCRKCPYNPKKLSGEDACPFNALYWDFLHKNRGRLSTNPRMSLSYKNLERKSATDLRTLRHAAKSLRERLTEREDL